MNIFQLSKISFPDRPKRRLKFLFRSIWYYRNLSKLYHGVPNESLNAMIDMSPEWLIKSFRPYMAKNISRKRSTDMIISHHKWIYTHGLTDVYKQGVKISDVIVDDVKYDFVLKHMVRFTKEGELTLALVDAERYYYVINFTISHGKVYIGGVQGVQGEDTFSKPATKACHGLRPKSLILEVLRRWLVANGLHCIYGISNDNHVLTHIRYKKKIKFNYDNYWLEHGGESIDNKFFSVPTAQPRKDLESLTRTKRKLYKKRYEFLDTLLIGS